MKCFTEILHHIFGKCVDDFLCVPSYGFVIDMDKQIVLGTMCNDDVDTVNHEFFYVCTDYDR